MDAPQIIPEAPQLGPIVGVYKPTTATWIRSLALTVVLFFVFSSVMGILIPIPRLARHYQVDVFTLLLLAIILVLLVLFGMALFFTVRRLINSITIVGENGFFRRGPKGLLGMDAVTILWEQVDTVTIHPDEGRVWVYRVVIETTDGERVVLVPESFNPFNSSEVIIGAVVDTQLPIAKKILASGDPIAFGEHVLLGDTLKVKSQEAPPEAVPRAFFAQIRSNGLFDYHPARFVIEMPSGKDERLRLRNVPNAPLLGALLTPLVIESVPGELDLNGLPADFFLQRWYAMQEIAQSVNS